MYHSTKRVSRVTVFAWKKKIPANEIEEIQGVCQRPMEAFGYVSMANVTRDQDDDNFLPVKPFFKIDL